MAFIIDESEISEDMKGIYEQYGKDVFMICEDIVISRVKKYLREIDVRSRDFFGACECALQEYEALKSCLQYIKADLLDEWLYEEPKESREPAYVYFVLNAEKDKVKIGMTKNLVQRCKNLQQACGEELELLHSIEFDSREDAYAVESALHRQFSYARKRPVKVKAFTKETEWFDGHIVDLLMLNYKTKEDCFALIKAQETSMREAVKALEQNFRNLSVFDEDGDENFSCITVENVPMKMK